MRKYICQGAACILIALALSTVFVPVSCRKGIRPETQLTSHPSNEYIDRVKKWYYEAWRNPANSSSRISPWLHDTSFIINNYANLALDWRFARVIQQGGATYTEVPAYVADTLGFKIGASDSTALTNLLSDSSYRSSTQSKIFWLLKEVPNESPIVEIVTFVGDYQYVLNNRTRFLTGISYFDLTDFTGMVLYDDRDGRLIRSFQYDRGNLINTIRCGVEGGLDPDPGNRVHLNVCLEILTWERDCVLLYDEYGAENRKQCTEWVLVGSRMVGNCWSNGYSGGSSNYSPYGEDGMDCASFQFSQTAGNWQEAGVKNSKVKIFWLGGGRHGQYINVNCVAPIIIGLPRHSAAGSISPGRAAEIAAWAHDQAVRITAASLKLNPTRPTDLEIENMYRRFVQHFILIHKGTADRTGSGSPNIVIKDAQYKFLGNGDCD